MRGLGTFLLVIGIVAGLFFNIIVGGILAVVGLLMVIAGGGSAPQMNICHACGNPVARTAAVCPTCKAALVPTEGPLKPKPAEKTKAERDDANRGLAALGIFLVLMIVVVFVLTNMH